MGLLCHRGREECLQVSLKHNPSANVRVKMFRTMHLLAAGAGGILRVYAMYLAIYNQQGALGLC